MANKIKNKMLEQLITHFLSEEKEVDLSLENVQIKFGKNIEIKCILKGKLSPSGSSNYIGESDFP